MATADATDIITNEGLPLREALALHCPFWPEHHRCEMLRIRMRAGAIRTADLTNSETLQFVAAGQVAWQRVIEWLYGVLDENGPWILTAYRSEDLQGEAKPFNSAVVRRLSFDKDHDTIRGPNGQLFYGPRIFSAASWKPKPKEPLLVKHAGPVPVEILSGGYATSNSRKKSRRVPSRKEMTKCIEYIVTLLRASPGHRTISVRKLREECCNNRFKITTREFDQCRQDALEVVPEAKKVWTEAGAPQKS